MKKTATARPKKDLATVHKAALAERITEALLTADDTGLTVKELSSELGVPNSSLHVWFSTTGKKRAEIVKVGEARYAWSAAYRPAAEPAATRAKGRESRAPKTPAAPPLSALDARPSTPPPETIVRLAPWQIDPDADQHRQTFDEEKLRRLGEDMLANGQDQPIIVQEAMRVGRKVEGENTRYKIIAGERRWRAANLVGMPSLKAIVRAVDDRQAMRIQAAENLQREGLNPVEEARAYRNLQDAGESPDVIQKTYSLSKSAYYGKLKMLELPPAGIAAVVSGRLGESIAIDLARLESAVQTSALERLLHDNAEGLNYRDQKRIIEELVDQAAKSAEWEAQVASYRAEGYRVLTLAESRHLSLSDTWIYDWNDTLNLEDETVLTAKVHEDPEQRTYEQIIGAERLHAIRSDIFIGRSSQSGKPVGILPKARLIELLKDTGFDLAAAESSQDGDIAANRAAAAREREIEGQIAAECRRQVIQQVKCTGTLIWKMLLRGNVDMTGIEDILEPVSEAIGAKEGELEARIEGKDVDESFEIIWKEIQVLSHDGMARLVAAIGLESYGFSDWQADSNASRAAFYGIDYDAIRTRIAGPVKTQKAA